MEDTYLKTGSDCSGLSYAVSFAEKKYLENEIAMIRKMIIYFKKPS